MATLYYDNATTDTDWNTLGNWWTTNTSGVFSNQASTLPTPSDSVELYATVTLNGGSEPTVVNCSTTSSISINITVTTMATFNGSSSNGATLTGNATFNDTSYNGGTVSGNAIWSAAAFTNFVLGTVSGTITFSSATAVVFTTDMGNGWTYDSSSWTFTTAGPTWIFDGGGTNNTGTLYGDATFNAGSYNSGTIYGDVTFNSTSSNGAGGETYGDAVFNDSSSNAGTVNNNPTALLLHFNGSDGSTTFTDSSPNELTATANGSVQISTAQSVFGGASALFNGSSDYLDGTVPDADWSVDFTVECWIRQSSIGGFQPVFGAGDIASGAGGINFYVDSTGLITMDNGLAGNISGGQVVVNTWTHLALVQSAGTSYGYQDGVLIGSGATNYPAQNGNIKVGAAPNYGWYFNGYIDEVRVVKGFAVYTSSFTPPTSQLGLYP